jgi:hypothetical protein
VARDQLQELAVGVFRSVMRRVRVAVSARVRSFDAATSTATIAPSVVEQRSVDGELLTVALADVPGVPVLMPGGTRRGFTFGLDSTDSVVAVVRHRSHDEVDGGTEALPASPAASRRMNYSDAVGLPGYVPPATGRPASHFRTDGQPVAYMESSDSLHVGESTAALLLARADRVEAELATLKSAISSAAVAGGDGGASFKAAILASLLGWPGDTSTPRIKVDK